MLFVNQRSGNDMQITVQSHVGEDGIMNNSCLEKITGSWQGKTSVFEEDWEIQV